MSNLLAREQPQADARDVRLKANRYKSDGRWACLHLLPEDASPQYNDNNARESCGGRHRIKQRSQPFAEIPPLWYPPKWGINGRLGVLPSRNVI